ncbi:TetR/AcrR family transcriptional regulator, partial [Mucilaginibacter pallidiroseus]
TVQKHPLSGAYLYNNFTLFQTLTQRGHFRLAKRGQHQWYIHILNISFFKKFIWIYIELKSSLKSIEGSKYMTRKVTSGPVRNKERTKANLIEAVGTILKKDGFASLSASRIAEEAKVDRRLIYDYYGGLEGLVRKYLDDKDYWKTGQEDLPEMIENAKNDAGKKLALGVLENQFDSLINNEEMRRIIAWGVSEKLPALKELDLNRERIGEAIISEVIDTHFAQSDKNFRAMYAILMGGVYYLTLHAKMQENTFCGLDIQQAAGQHEIKKALGQFIDFIYQ